jgi:hypothetical protein
VVDFRDGHACALEKALTRDRRPHTVQLTFEQRNAEFVFERPNATANCGLSNAENFGRPAEARVIGDDQRLGYGNKINDAAISYRKSALGEEPLTPTARGAVRRRMN